jgi:ABC-type glycerol-3-phosphate transport system substrate-binding protein
MVWMYGHEKRKQFSINHGMCPVLESVAKESYFADDPNWRVFTEQQNAKFHPTSKDWDRYVDEGMKQIQAVYIGDKTPTEAIDDWQKLEP